jgi:hypothetical protein
MFSPITRRLFLLFITTVSVIQLYAHSHQVVLGTTSPGNFDTTAAEIANQVTVRILTKFGSGSGVVIKHEGQTYTVLTNNHVVVDSPEDGYEILTTDGNIYLAEQVNCVNGKNLDLALVKFTSPEDYQVVALPFLREKQYTLLVFPLGILSSRARSSLKWKKPAIGELKPFNSKLELLKCNWPKLSPVVIN